MKLLNADQTNYPISCKLEGFLHFMIYSMGDEDFLAFDKQHYLVFNHIDELISYAQKQNIAIEHSEGITVYDFDHLRKFLSDDPKAPENPDELMECWNLFDDMNNFDSLAWRKFSALSQQNRVLHEKLLFGSKVFGEHKAQKWDINELSSLRDILEIGFFHYKIATNILKNSETKS